MSDQQDRDYDTAARARTRWQVALLWLGLLALCLVCVVGPTAWVDDRPAAGIGSHPWFAQLGELYLSAVMGCVTFFVFVLLVALSVGLAVGMRKLPPLFVRVFHVLHLVQARVERVLGAARRGVIAPYAAAAWIGRFVRSAYAGLRPLWRHIGAPHG